MKALKFWVMLALIFFTSMVAAVPTEARAGKDLGVTEKQFITSCNKELSKDGLRFVKNEKYKGLNKFMDENDKWTASYAFYNDRASLLLQEDSTGKLVRITLSGWNPLQGTPVMDPIAAFDSVIKAVLQSSSDIEKFTNKLEGKLQQGLDKFIITFRGKKFDIVNSPPYVIGLDITSEK